MAASGARLIPMAFAGFGGAAVFQNSEKALEYVSELLRLILGRVDRLGGAGGGGGGDAALLERLNSLASKVDVALLNARAAPSPTVVVREGGSGAGARAAVAGAAALVVYAKVRGYGLSDLKPVTAKTLTSAMGSVGKSLGAVSDLVTNVRSALTERIDKVSQSVDDVHEELGEVHEGVEEAKQEIVATREVIDDIALKQDYSARGIHALCGVVSELLKNAAQTPAIANLQNFTLIGARTRGVTPPPLHDAPSRPPLAPPRDPADDLDDGACAASDLQAAIKNIEALGARAQEATSP